MGRRRGGKALLGGVPDARGDKEGNAQNGSQDVGRPARVAEYCGSEVNAKMIKRTDNNDRHLRCRK